MAVSNPPLSLPSFISHRKKVRGAVIINGCERVRITVACRKLVVLNCLECEFNVATMSATVISGDSRSLVFGPFNTAYTHLRLHLQVRRPLSSPYLAPI